MPEASLVQLSVAEPSMMVLAVTSVVITTQFWLHEPGVRNTYSVRYCSTGGNTVRDGSPMYGPSTS